MGTQLVEMKSFSAQYPVLAPGNQAAELLRQNLAGESVGMADLERVKVPAGGGVAWTVKTLEGDKTVKSLEGVLLHVVRRRAYWKSANPSGDQPDCSSNDCVTGIGEPGGACISCPLNQFGTAAKQGGGVGRGKACKESVLLFLLQPGALLPTIVVTPAGSLKAVKQYRLKLAEGGVPYHAAVTRLELAKTTNKDGIAYSQIAPSFAGQLPPEAAAQVQAYAATLGNNFDTVSVSREEVEGDHD